MMMTDVPDEHEGAFNDWYNKVHIPELLRIPGFVSAERFRRIGPGIRYLALYRLRDAAVLEGEVFATWRANSESTKLWASRFTASQRHLYERVFSSDIER